MPIHTVLWDTILHQIDQSLPFVVAHYNAQLSRSGNIHSLHLNDMADLCKVCGNLELEKISDDSRNEDYGYPTFASLRESASRGCPVCRLFVTGLLRKTLKVNPKWTEAEAIQRIIEDDHLPGTNIKLFAPWKADNQRRLLDRLTLASTQSGPVEFCISTSRDHHKFVIRRPTNSHVDLRLARAWIQTCSTQHKDCSLSTLPKAQGRLLGALGKSLDIKRRYRGMGKDSKLPTRVIDIGDGESPPKLVETRGRRGKYCCLSHCWGLTHPTTTIRDNYEDHLSAIPWNTLTHTIRDALFAARELGYRYIWIDSFCIIQHDIDDWVREGSQMQSIFENCSVTIAAAAAPNAESGFLHPRPPAVSAECSLQAGSDDLILALPERSLDVHYTEPPFDKNVPRSERPRLFTRAWVLQERLLPPRVLYFGTHELYYECRTCSLRESSWIPVHSPVEDIGGLQNMSMNSIFGPIKEVECLEAWLGFVAQHASLGLTNWTDRLPAISGLARKFATIIGQNYVAGLWNTSLLKQLNWRHVRAIGDAETGYDPSVYIAPSWSWASSTGRISFLNYDQEYLPIADIESCEAKLATSDPFGQVESGFIKITAKVQTFVLARRIGKTLDEYIVRQPQEMDKGAGVCLFDRPLPSPEDNAEVTVECIVFGKQSVRYKRPLLTYTGLALELVSSKISAYKRLGTFTQMFVEEEFERLWDEIKPRKITII